MKDKLQYIVDNTCTYVCMYVWTYKSLHVNLRHKIFSVSQRYTHGFWRMEDEYASCRINEK